MKKRVIVLFVLLCVVSVSVYLFFHNSKEEKIKVGILTSRSSGSIIGSSEIHAGNLFDEDYPNNLIEQIILDDEWKPEKSVEVVKKAIRDGITLFVTSHPSNCAVASKDFYNNPDLLFINLAATTTALTNLDDSFIRIIADAEMEQKAIAKYFNENVKGSKLLVIQDTSNLAYTSPAFNIFSEEIRGKGKWLFDRYKILVSDFKPDEVKKIMGKDYDALYILAGTFQAGIGNVAQIFHYLHPDKPIMLTPWARSPAILDIAGDAIDKIILPSQYSSRLKDTVIDNYFKRYIERFGYRPHSMTIAMRQSLEILNQAFLSNNKNANEVKRFLLNTPYFETTLGRIRINKFGDYSAEYNFITDIRAELK